MKFEWDLTPTENHTELNWSVREKYTQSAWLMLIKEYWADGDVDWAEILYDTSRPFDWRGVSVLHRILRRFKGRRNNA